MPIPFPGIVVPRRQVPQQPESSLTPPTSVGAQQGEEFDRVQLLAELMRANKNLTSVSADESCFRYKNGTDAFLLFIASCPSISLERLELWFRNQRSQSIPAADRSTPFHDRSLMLSALAIPVFKALKELVLSGSHRPIDAPRLGFLCRCPNLEQIQVNNIGLDSLRTLSVGLRSNCPHLSRPEFRGHYKGIVEDISPLLAASRSYWKELSLPDMNEFNLMSFGVVMRSVETRLEVLKVKGWGRLLGSHCLELLCSAKNLRRLEGIVDKQRKRYTTEILVHAQETYLDHIMGGTDRSWVLGPSMEYFQLRLEGVPRPDVLYQQSGGDLVIDHALDPTLRLDVQRWIYTQLSRMTGLRELILGLQDLSAATMRSHEIDPSMDAVEMEEAVRQDGIRMFNYQSLEFSLESGLDLLAGLKEMRILDVRSTAHYIGVAELEWMHRNWPKLERIRGLESDRRWSVNHPEGPAAKAAVEEWMAGHPHGIGSFY